MIFQAKTIERFAQRYGLWYRIHTDSLDWQGSPLHNPIWVLSSASNSDPVHVRHRGDGSVSIVRSRWHRRVNRGRYVPRDATGLRGVYEMVVYQPGKYLWGAPAATAREWGSQHMRVIHTLDDGGEPTVRFAAVLDPDPYLEACFFLHKDHRGMALQFLDGALPDGIFRDWLIDQGYLEMQ